MTRHLVKAVAAGTVVAAAALPVAIATGSSVAGAATSPTLYCSQRQQPSSGQFNVLGQPYCATMPWSTQNSELAFWVYGSNLGFDNGAASATTTATGVTVLGVDEVNTYSAIVFLAIGSTTAPGYYSLSITDGNGTSTLKNAFGVDAGSTVTSFTPTTVPEGSTTLITVTGTNLTNEVFADPSDPSGFTVLGGYRSPQVNAAGTQLTFYVQTSASLALGTYGVEIPGLNTNDIFGNPGIDITVTGAEILSVSPTEYTGASGQNTHPVASTLTITGASFAQGAQVVISTESGISPATAGVTFGAPTVVNTTSITVPVTNASADTTDLGQWNVTVTNPDGTTSELFNAIGFNEAATNPSAGGATLTLISDDLAPGTSTITVEGSSSYPLSYGDTVTLSLGRFTFTGTVTDVFGSNEAQITFDLPAVLSTTVSAAVSAGATSVPVASISGIPTTGGDVTFDDTGDVTAPTGVVSSTSTMTVLATAHAHSAGAVVQWSIGEDTGWTLTVNNGTSSLSLAGLGIANPSPLPADVSIIDTSGNSQTVSANTATNPVPLAPGTYTFYVNLPGANLAKTGNTITFSNGTSDAAGITGTIVAVGQDSAWVTVTEPGSSTTPTYTTTGDTLTAATVIGQTYLDVSAITGLVAGDTYNLGGGAAGSENFTIASSWDGSSTTIPLTAALTQPHTSGTTIYTISSAQVTGVDYSMSVVSGNGGGIVTYPMFETENSDFSFTCISLGTGCPASPGLVLGAGASNVPVNIVGSFTNTNALDYVVTSTTPGVSFGAVSAVDGTDLSVTVSVAAGTAVTSNVQYTVVELTGAGTFSLPNSGQASTYFLIGMTPTISAVTGLPSSMVPGDTANFTVTGTFFDSSTSAWFDATTGNLAGLPDTGAFLGYGDNGVSVTGCTDVSSTTLDCTVHVSQGAANGPHTLVIENGEYGTASFANALTVVNATIGSISPTTFQTDTGSVTFTLSGLNGFNVTQDTSSMDGYVTTFTASGIPVSQDNKYTGGGYNTVTTYAGPNSVNVTVNTGNLTRPPGGVLVVTLYQNPSASGYGVEIDAPAILLGLPLAVSSPAAETPAGTSTGFGIAATCTQTDFSYPFNDTYCYAEDYPTAFQPGATVTAPAGSGVTVSGVTVLPGLITGTVTVAAGTPAGDVTLTVTNPDGGVAYSTLVITPSPIITSVNGTPVISGPVSFLSGSKTTLSISGANFEAGVVVSDSVSGDATFGTAAVNAAGTLITVSVQFISFTGATPLSTGLVVTNPDGGVGAVPGELVVNPEPAVTGGPYYVPTFTSNTELVITGTGFQQGMTVSSSNSAYTVSVASVLPTSVTLLVSTTSAATSGTFTTLTFTNPDGGTTTVQLNGGPPPTPKATVHSTVGRPAHIGKTTTFVITGTNLSGEAVSVNKKGVTVTKVGNTSTSVTIHVKVAKTVKVGTAILTLTNANGQLRIAFSIKR